ncbi:unnamed protein product [Mycena citricolor]|uniref:F-box domain-containing protein n=1 Tax=Mycena citricolor TaxID=2018698 RepID=A0AAD2Q2A8_9AGAR|nr:unnamed protein product [Mycena citricolor]
MSSFLKKWGLRLPIASSEVSSVKTPLSSTPILPQESEHGFAALPNELIPSILSHLVLSEPQPPKTLVNLAQVSRRFNDLATRAWLSLYGVTAAGIATGCLAIRTDDSEAAAHALKSALFFRTNDGPGVQELRWIAEKDSLDVRGVEELASVVHWAAALSRPDDVGLSMHIDLGMDGIQAALTSRSMARAVVLLLRATTDCTRAVTAVVMTDGLLTCRPDGLKKWSPSTGNYDGTWKAANSYASITMHDRSKQSVPTIRTMQTLSATFRPRAEKLWNTVVLDAHTLTDLQLTIKLAPNEWDAVLGSLHLPALVCVGLWAPEISVETSTRFLNRHRRVTTIKNMTAYSVLEASGAPLSLPKLQTLNALVPFVLHVLSPGDADARFPHLAHIELRQHAQLPDCLRLLASHLPTLSALTLWTLHAMHFTSWPVLPNLRRITFNECRIPASGGSFDAIMTPKTFPALSKVEVNYTWSGSGDVLLSVKQIRKDRRVFADRVRVLHPGVQNFVFDGQVLNF